MEEQLNQLHHEVASLREQIEQLTAMIETLTSTTRRMDDHIDFVEQTYNSIRSPLEYLRGRWSSDGTQSLPLRE